MILLTGATGQLGRTAICQSLKQAYASQLTAFVRDENKATHLRGQGVTYAWVRTTIAAALKRGERGQTDGKAP